MKVVIVGAGAIGLLIGSYIGGKNHEITYVTRTSKQANDLRALGVTRIDLDGERVICPVDATSEIRLAPTDALWIVAVKYHHLPSMERELQSLPVSTRIAFIQNGLAHLKWMGKLKQDQIFIATIEHGAMKKDPTTVLHKGVGITKVAPFRKRTTEQLDLTIFSSPSFEMELLDDAHGLVLRKAILNACINPITAILHIKNGELVSNQHARQLMTDLFKEIERAFPETGTMVSLEDVFQLCGKTAHNLSSMVQDLQNRRRTEIEPIVGALIQMAEDRNKPMPFLNMLYQMVLALETKGDSDD